MWPVKTFRFYIYLKPIIVKVQKPGKIRFWKTIKYGYCLKVFENTYPKKKWRQNSMILFFHFRKSGYKITALDPVLQNHYFKNICIYLAEIQVSRNSFFSFFSPELVSTYKNRIGPGSKEPMCGYH